MCSVYALVGIQIRRHLLHGIFQTVILALFSFTLANELSLILLFIPVWEAHQTILARENLIYPEFSFRTFSQWLSMTSLWCALKESTFKWKNTFWVWLISFVPLYGQGKEWPVLLMLRNCLFVCISVSLNNMSVDKWRNRKSVFTKQKQLFSCTCVCMCKYVNCILMWCTARFSLYPSSPCVQKFLCLSKIKCHSDFLRSVILSNIRHTPSLHRDWLVWMSLNLNHSTEARGKQSG